MSRKKRSGRRRENRGRRRHRSERTSRTTQARGTDRDEVVGKADELVDVLDDLDRAVEGGNEPDALVEAFNRRFPFDESLGDVRSKILTWVDDLRDAKRSARSRRPGTEGETTR